MQFRSEICNHFHNQKIAILGFGLEGKSTLNFISSCGNFHALHIFDEGEILWSHKDENNIHFRGKSKIEDIDFSDFDLIFKSPGISRKRMLNHAELAPKITSQTEIFLEYYREQVVGITGTKGKSTTTTLLYQILKKAQNQVLIAGNIGVPFFDIIPLVTDQSLLVAELSCHQLDSISFSPRIAIILNLFEDHLDAYDNSDEYFRTKLNIYAHQNSDDILFYHSNDQVLHKYLKLVPPKSRSRIVVPTGTTGIDSKKSNESESIAHAQGSKHGIPNLEMVTTVARYLKVEDKIIEQAISEFKSLPYRLEFVGEFHGMKVYNDSIATVPEATILALNTLKCVNTLIIGGLDRGINYEKLIDFLCVEHFPQVVLFYGTAGKRVYSACIEQKTMDYETNSKEFTWFDSFNTMVEYAISKTPGNGILLLSPAAASFDLFRDYMDRGAEFNRLVTKTTG